MEVELREMELLIADEITNSRTLQIEIQSDLRKCRDLIIVVEKELEELRKKENKEEIMRHIFDE